MSAPEEMEALRTALQEDAARSSYRRLSDQVDLSPRAIQMFVAGEGVPRGRTMHLLREWYSRRAAARAEPTGAEALYSPTRLLSGITGVRARAQAIQQITEFFEQLYAREGVPPPAWIREVRAK